VALRHGAGTGAQPKLDSGLQPTAPQRINNLRFSALVGENPGPSVGKRMSEARYSSHCRDRLIQFSQLRITTPAVMTGS